MIAFSFANWFCKLERFARSGVGCSGTVRAQRTRIADLDTRHAERGAAVPPFWTCSNAAGNALVLGQRARWKAARVRQRDYWKAAAAPRSIADRLAEDEWRSYDEVGV